MRFTRVYLIGGTQGKANEDDFIVAYKSENGNQIKVRNLVNSTFQWYEVNGKTYETLKQAKAACHD